ncbi:hypothetical protein [Persicobacter sp. CCB-QB2]|uniref:hypothetical protein n=1 Tax=Persicobacter sp. CCB-QB2 TaxID=1561025 RepID=UPI0006A96F0F|nr:hypothetical protein [Persicobacter sp. CCB-QB2]
MDTKNSLNQEISNFVFHEYLENEGDVFAFLKELIAEGTEEELLSSIKEPTHSPIGKDISLFKQKAFERPEENLQKIKEILKG